MNQIERLKEEVWKMGLGSKKNAMVNEMGRWEQGQWIWDLPWRRVLRSSEVERAEDLLRFLSSFSLLENTSDSWTWKGNPTSTFSVNNLYKELRKIKGHTTRQSPSSSHIFKCIWNSTAPFKAQIVGWRAILNRLPTHDNLRKRINTASMDPRCCFCEDVEDSCSHLFLECAKIRPIWDDLIKWIGVDWAAPFNIRDHLYSFSSLLGEGRHRKNLCGLWICVIWVWWKRRNAILFEKEVWDTRRILEEIKCRFWNWCVIRGEADQAISFVNWCSSRLCDMWPSSTA